MIRKTDSGLAVWEATKPPEPKPVRHKVEVTLPADIWITSTAVANFVAMTRAIHKVGSILTLGELNGQVIAVYAAPKEVEFEEYT